jgi:UDP-N-acetylglucosamine 2-epimerase (non-hydrolysing)
MQKIKILSVVGARPNFIKIAPIHDKFVTSPKIEHRICHTGQHYDNKMSDIFFAELEMPQPSFFLNAGGGSHTEQTATIMERFEKVCIEYKPDIVLVPGDVNSTLACSLTASKLGIKVGHIEAGLRSFDRTMPEEINRIVTDSISDFLFVTEASGLVNLGKEGVSPEKIFFVGNTMIDTLVKYYSKIKSKKKSLEFNVHQKKFVVVTFHRPSNVDNPENLRKLVDFIEKISHQIAVIFPIHPRTRLNLNKFGYSFTNKANIKLIEPLGYIDFLSLVYDSAMVITDSGGIQEETTYMGIPCITVRNSTERPVTIQMGTNILAGTNLTHVLQIFGKLLNREINFPSMVPPLWDGKASERINNVIEMAFSL